MIKLLALVLSVIMSLAPPALAATVLLDQIPAPAPAAGNTSQQSELLTQGIVVPGGMLYVTTLKQSGNPGALVSASTTFVPTSGGVTRYLPLPAAKSDTGVALTATATGGNVGVARTAGTSLTLVGEATSASAKTDKALWALNLTDSYVANADIPLTVNANYTGAGTVTGASTKITVTAYTEVNGVETALTVSAAKLLTPTATDLTFTITGTGLTPGAAVVVEVTMLVTTSAGAATGQINAVSLTM